MARSLLTIASGRGTIARVLNVHNGANIVNIQNSGTAQNVRIRGPAGVMAGERRMVPEHLDDALMRFTEDFGALFSEAGVPPVAGRVMAMLLVTDEEALPTSRFVDALGASKGAISMATRLLVQFRMLERFRVRGSREAYFRIPDGFWVEALKQKVAIIGSLRAMAERGLEAVGDAPRARARLEEMRDIYGFFEESLPVLFDRWERERGGK